MSITNEIPVTSQPTLPEQFCNLDRLLAIMERDDIDGLVVNMSSNVYYLSGFAAPSAQGLGDDNPLGTVVINRHDPESAVVVVPEHDIVYFRDQPSWIKDVRPYATGLQSLDLLAAPSPDAFIPASMRDLAWVRRARENYATSASAAVDRAVVDAGLSGRRVGVDNLRSAGRITTPVTTVDGDGVLREARVVKTPHEVDLLTKAARLNQQALQRTVDTCEPGMMWSDVVHTYHLAAVDQGGFVSGPSGIAVANPNGTDQAFTLSSGRDNPELHRGAAVMFDCHGAVDKYCWDGGKTWVIAEEPSAHHRNLARVTDLAMGELLASATQGTRVSELQETMRNVFRRAGLPDADRMLLFFHGLGLDHQDHPFDPIAGPNWQVEMGMMLSVHVYYPGTEFDRFYFETIAHITSDSYSIYDAWDAMPF